MLALVLGLAAAAQTPAAPVLAAPAVSAPASAAAAARGRELFTGAVRFQNGGPACAECHTIAGLPFPGGGTLAPDLTGIDRRLGPVGMQYALRTLFFPAMVPIYSKHQLTAAEQADLAAFFAAAPLQPQPHNTGKVVLIVIAGCVFLFLLTGFFWRDRLRGVRAPLVRQAREAARQARHAAARGGADGTAPQVHSAGGEG